MEDLTSLHEDESAAQIADDIMLATAVEPVDPTAAEQVEKAQTIAHRIRPNLRTVLEKIDANATDYGFSPEEVRAAKRDAVLMSKPR